MFFGSGACFGENDKNYWRKYRSYSMFLLPWLRQRADGQRFWKRKEHPLDDRYQVVSFRDRWHSIRGGFGCDWRNSRLYLEHHGGQSACGNVLEFDNRDHLRNANGGRNFFNRRHPQRCRKSSSRENVDGNDCGCSSCLDDRRFDAAFGD
jgi:hypothetical protein